MLVALGGRPETSGGLSHRSPHGGLGQQPAWVDQIRRLGRRTKQEREGVTTDRCKTSAKVKLTAVMAVCRSACPSRTGDGNPARWTR
jgi:hypothetical protein